MSEAEERKGVIYGLVAYLVWGGFPLYFRFLQRSNSFEIIADRIIFSLVFCLILVAFLRRWGRLRDVIRRPRLLGGIALGGALVTTNWTIYVWGVNSGRTIDAALGYFINPLISTLLGVFVLGERLRRGQLVAYGIGVLAVLVLVMGYGKVPWVALGVSISFAFYGLVKNRVGQVADPLTGLVFETAAVLPFAIISLVVLAGMGELTTNLHTGYGWVLVLAGPLTAIPLLLFAASAARVSLIMIGILQYICPAIQFLIGWLVFGEHMTTERWIGFVLIWAAIALFTLDSIVAARRIGHGRS